MPAIEAVFEPLHAALIIWAATVPNIVSRALSNVVETVAGTQWSPYDSLIMDIAS